MPATESRLFAIVPAAGHSRRMGQPKLLLPLGNSTMIGRLIRVLRRPEISETVVVLRPDDDALRSAITESGATALQPPIAPDEMRQSVQFGLDYLKQRHNPRPGDGWILIPADHPLLDATVLDALLARWTSAEIRILVPRCENRRGHPTFFRWDLAPEVERIPSNHGLNWMLREHAADIVELGVESRTVLLDLDTPEDYAAALAELGE